MPHLKSIRAWTLIEVFIAVAIAAILLGTYLSFFADSGIQHTTTAKWTYPSATVSQRPNTGTFTYTLTRQVGSAAPQGIPLRGTTIAVFPSTGGIIIDELNSLAVGGTSGRATTDGAGQVVVVIKLDYMGVGRIVATDHDTGRSEEVVFTGVP